MSWTKEQLANHPRLGQLIGIMPAKKKATDEQLKSAYKETGSIWAVAGRYDMCGQSVHERLTKIGIIESNAYTTDQKKVIREFYKTGFKKGNFSAFCKLNGLLPTSASRWARSEGLTDVSREYSPEVAAKMGRRVSAQWANGNHPKGMLGKHHSEATKSHLSNIGQGRKFESERTHKILKTRLERYGTLAPKMGRGSWKAQWIEVGGQRFYSRSLWESNYAFYLEFLRDAGEVKAWKHEPETFWFEGIRRGCCSYLPDYKVTMLDNSIEYHEVKGWMDARSITKIKRMAKYHPAVKLVVRDAKWYRANKFQLSRIVKGWQ